MSRPTSWATALLLATTLVAQQGPPDPVPPKPAPATAGSAAERLQALLDDQKRLSTEWQQKMRDAQAAAKEAAAAGQPIPAIPMRPDLSPLLATAQAAADEFAGTPDAAPFLAWIVQSGASGKAKAAATAAFTTLVDKHLDHPSLVALGGMLPMLSRLVDKEQVPALLERLAKSESPDLRGWVAMASHRETIDKADREGDGYKTARMELVKAAEIATDPRLKKEITGAIDLREKYGIGCTAPDIEGQDLDGVAFKLSDYRGKVVFLDFWGDW